MAAKDNVIIRMSAEDAGAFEEWRKQAKGPEMMGDAIEKAATKGKQHSGDLGKSLTNLVGTWTSITAAIGLFRQMMADAIATSRQLAQEQAGSTAAADAAMRKYFVTAKIGDPAQQAMASQRIGNIAIRQKEKLSTAGGAASLLAEFGVSREQAEGESLDQVLDLYDALGSTSADKSGFTRQILKILQRSKAGITPKSIRQVGITARSLMSSGAGFNEETLGEYASVAGDASAGGMDQGTGLALWTAIRQQVDEAKRAKNMFRDFMKPGMQAGEADYRKRAAALLAAGGGEAAYKQSADISDQSVAALIDETETAGTLATAGSKKLTTDQIRKRLQAVMRSYGVTEQEYGKGVVNYDHDLAEFITLGAWQPSDEQRVSNSLRELRLSRGQSPGLQAMMSDMGKARGQILGQQPITIRIKGQDGRDVPHQVEAAGIQGR